MSSIKGFSTSTLNIKAPEQHPDAKVRQQFMTLTPAGYDKHGLDVVLKAHYPLSATATTIDAGQPTEDADRILNITGHGARQGDVIRFSTGSSLEGLESEIIKIVDANTVVLATKLPSNPVGGTDTVDILRGVTLRTSSNGTLQASSGPVEYVLDGTTQQVVEDTTTASNNRFIPMAVSFDLDGVPTRVLKDTTTPSNTRPLPVELISTSGTPATFNLTTGDIAIHTAHDGNTNAGYDSMRLGDGSNLAAVNASNELAVKDVDNETLLTSIDGKLPASLGAKLGAASLSVVMASDSSPALPTDAATETKQDDGITQLTNISGKLPTTLGQKVKAASLAVTIASDQEALPLSTGASTEAKQDDGITQLTGINGKLPATLGSKTGANSLSVVLASDTADVDIRHLNVTDDKVAIGNGANTLGVNADGSINVVSSATSSVTRAEAPFRQDYSVTSVTTAAYTEVIGITSNDIKALEIFDSSGETMVLAVGAASSEVNQFHIFPGGNGKVDLFIASGSRISIRAISADATVGEININFFG